MRLIQLCRNVIIPLWKSFVNKIFSKRIRYKVFLDFTSFFCYNSICENMCCGAVIFCFAIEIF